MIVACMIFNLHNSSRKSNWAKSIVLILQNFQLWMFYSKFVISMEIFINDLVILERESMANDNIVYYGYYRGHRSIGL